MNNQPSTVFADYARYYDLLYRDKDYAAEAEYVAGLIRKFHPEARSILELGSGTGKHALLLAQKDFEVHGVELSEEMINIARSNALSSPQPSTFNLQLSTFNQFSQKVTFVIFDWADSLTQ